MRSYSTLFKAAVVASASTLYLAACGGGSDVFIGAQEVRGLAAEGAAIKNKTVTVKCANKSIPGVITDASGNYGFSSVGVEFPCALQVQASTGERFHSYTNGAGIANITGLTEIAMAMALGGGQTTEAWFGAADPAGSLAPSAVSSAGERLQTALQAKNYGDVPDIFGTSFQANGQGMDGVLDALGNALRAEGSDFVDLGQSAAESGSNVSSVIPQKPTATNTPVPTATNTPVPTATNTPAPTATNTPIPTATNTPVPTATSTPVPTATNTPLPTATNTPVPTGSETPDPVVTETPVPTVTDTPVPTATNTPVPTATDTPVPTATNTPVPTATNTPEPATSSCIPSAPAPNQTIVVNTVGDDVSGAEHGGDSGGLSWFPDGLATWTYQFNASGNAFTLTTSDPSTGLPWSGASLNGMGETINEQAPVITRENAKEVSFVGFQPSDWAQRLARQLDGQAVGSTASIPVRLDAKGALPSFLLDAVVGTNPEPETERLFMNFTINAKRLANGVVNGIESCKFEYGIDRPTYVAGVRTPGQHGTPSNPLAVTPADEAATLDAIHMSGTVMDQAEGDPNRFFQRLLEPYFPAMHGTFATSSQVPYVPVQLYLEHDYGISSQSDPYYQTDDGNAPSKATPPLSKPATQLFDFKQSTP